MEKLPHAKHFQELLGYQKARNLAKDVYEVTKLFPREEKYALTDQIRRCSRSIGAQIAEAWAKRKYEKHFISKLSDADGEQLETQHWIGIAYDCGYLSEDQAISLKTQSKEIGRILHGMTEKAKSFCGVQLNEVKENISEYIIENIEFSEEVFTDY